MPKQSSDELAFETSGHTGRPVAWWRTRAQMQRELEIVLDEAGARFERVISFATTKHLYGYLYAGLLPDIYGIDVVEAWKDPLKVPTFRSRERVLIVGIPSAWPLLKRMLKTAMDASGVTLLHSTSVLPPIARPIIEGFTEREAHLVEVLGSTETGAIAWRDMDEGLAPWRLFDDVELIPHGGGHTQPLHVKSPRIGRRADMAACPDAWEMPDVIQPLCRRCFRHIGRSSRFLKVDGLRCDLDIIENFVRSLDGMYDAACVARSSSIRGEHYDIYYSADSPHVDEKQIRSLLRAASQRIPAPRLIRRVPAIPRTSLGKICFSELTA